MADTYDELLRIRFQQTGNNRDTWGGLLNTAALGLLVKAMHGKVEIPVAGSDVTLTSNLGAEDQARYAVLDLIGAPGAARNIIVPAKAHIYIVRNSTGSTMTIKTSGGTGAAILDGATSQVLCDGTDCEVVSPTLPEQAQDSAKLGGIPAASWARLNAAQAFSKGQKFVPVDLSMGASVTPDLAEGNVFTGVLTANATLEEPDNLDPDNSQVFYVHLKQAATGGPYTLAFDAFYDFLGDDPVIGATASADMLLACVYLPELGKALCFAVVQQDAPAPSTEDLTLSVNESNVDVFRRVGSPAGVVTVNLTLAAGVVIRSDRPGYPALDFGGGFASGSTINFTNLGFVIGCGGNGKSGGAAGDDGNAEFCIGLNSNADGGNAIRGAGAGVTLNITNANGRIWGGGGGGGGGGARAATDDDCAGGGGGGGGAGGGLGGPGARCLASATSSIAEGDQGTPGVLNLNGSAANGTGGAGVAIATGTAGNGGAGGDYGADGSNGGAVTATATFIAATTGGAAGKAVDVNSSTVNFISGSGSPQVKGAVS